MITILDIETAGRDLRISDERARSVIRDLIGKKIKVEIPLYGELEGWVEMPGFATGDVRIRTRKGVRVVNLFRERTKILSVEGE